MIATSFPNFLDEVLQNMLSCLDLCRMRSKCDFEKRIPHMLRPFNFTRVEEEKISSHIFGFVFKNLWDTARNHMHIGLQAEKEMYMTRPEAALWNPEDNSMRARIIKIFFTIYSKEVQTYCKVLERETKRLFSGTKESILIAVART